MEVRPGVSAPPSVNLQLRRIPPPDVSPVELDARLRAGDRAALAQAITLIESEQPTHHDAARELIDLALSQARASRRIGFTGVPGVGKSTLINQIGLHWIAQGHRVAVLAVDPSSVASRGSILGDKGRMPGLAVSPQAFVRPSPGGQSLGGVAHKTREAALLCEAAGYDIIAIETIGVGQSEVAVHAMVDCFLLLMLPGAGDELQGLKRGIMEMADVVAVTKSDHENVARAQLACSQIQNALHYLAPTPSGWSPTAQCVSSEAPGTVGNLANSISEFLSHEERTGWFARRRAHQALEWMEELVVEQVVRTALLDPRILALRDTLAPQVSSGILSARRAADEILQALRHEH